jgi:branched-chain amino acid transport system substrate-binding protein
MIMRLFKSSFKTFLTFIITAFCLPCLNASQLSENQDKTVKIGLLVPDIKSVAALLGAEIAVNEANRKGGLNGIPFELVTRYMEGPWGTGSKEAVSLIFEEKVWAILGSHDGRNAHLVEQAATKATIVFMSSWAGDPTLSQAFVPWFFNCVPNDRQQAEALIEEIYNIRRIEKIAVVSDNAYDSKQALKNFLDNIKSRGKNEPVQFIYDNSDGELNTITDNITKASADCIVLFCEPLSSLKIIRQIHHNKMKQPVFGSLSIVNENELTEQELQEMDNSLMIPSGKWSLSKNSVFTQEYRELYGKTPGLVAAYAYDGMNLIIEALKEASVPEREKIQKALENIHYEGVTGPVQFDDKGNRIGPFKTTELKNGIPEREIPR